MLGNPNPALNEEERELSNSAPEECLSQAVQRGAIALDEMEAVSPRVAAVVRSIATGERLALPEKETLSEVGTRTPPPSDRKYDWTLKTLSQFPQLTRLLSDQVLTSDEAMQVAHTIDNMLGRYMTGTRYAAP
jgi:hypothetical protein